MCYLCEMMKILQRQYIEQKSPETTCNDNGTGEAKRLIFEGVKHHNSRDIKLHLLKHALEINHQYVSEKDFKITGHGFRGTKQEKKSS